MNKSFLWQVLERKKKFYFHFFKFSFLSAENFTPLLRIKIIWISFTQPPRRKVLRRKVIYYIYQNKLSVHFESSSGQGVGILEISDIDQGGRHRFFGSDLLFIRGWINFFSIFYFFDEVFTLPKLTFFHWILCNRSIVCLFSDKFNDYSVINPINFKIDITI